MQTSMRVKVLSPAKPLADVEAVSVSVPGSLGDMEVLVNHAPMVAELDVGSLKIKKATGETLKFFISGGYIDVMKNEVKVLIDVGETPDSIDIKRAEGALKRADERLLNVRDVTIDLARAQYAKKRATHRLQLAKDAGQGRH